MPIRAPGQLGPRSLPFSGDAALLDLVRSVPYEQGAMHVGILGTGDLFSREADRID